MKYTWTLLTLALFASSARPQEVSGKISFRDKLYDIAAAGDVVIVVGYPGLVLRSQDRGSSWTLVDIGFRDALFGVKLLEDGRGLAVGRSGKLFFTEDAGKTWQPRDSGVREHLFDVELLPSGMAWAVGSFGVILHSRDGGRSWERQSFDAVPPEGSVLSNAEIENEGAAEEARLNAVSFSDDDNGVIVGEFGLVLRSQDGGASWKRQRSGTGMVLFGIQRLDAKRLLASGAEGTLIETRDGGTTWNVLATPVKQHFFCPVSSTSGIYLPSLDGLIFRLGFDGSWETFDLGIPAWLNAMLFLDDKTAMVAGARGHLFLTRDGWKTWQKISGR